MNITHLKKEYVLAALYNNAQYQGMGFLQANDREMSVVEATALLEKSHDNYFDYVGGRVMKIRIEDELNTRLYNRDNGEGSAEKAINSIQDVEALIP